jgi:hypothetical protein
MALPTLALSGRCGPRSGALKRCRPANQNSMVSTTLPSVDDIIGALIPFDGRLPALEAAAVHLATPVDVVIGPGIWRHLGTWRYRGHQIPIVGNELFAAAENAVKVARAGHRRGDVYLDVAEGPQSWAKVLSSGARQVAFGLPLFGGPALTADRGVPAATIAEVAAAAIAGTLSPPAVIALADRVVLVSGDAQLWHLHAEEMSR